MKHSPNGSIVDAWYSPESRWLNLLLPLAWCLQGVAQFRRKRLQRRVQLLPVPVVVVGNISLGGTGKTPLLAAMAKKLVEQGFKPGIISRGYGGTAPSYPFSVTPTSAPHEAGDEPVLLAQITGCPVVVDPDRTSAANWLLAHFDCDVLLSDDGLQHYALARNIEIAVVDGVRGLGNGKCIPAGPLREPPVRLQSVDWVIVNGGLQMPLGVPNTAFKMQLKPTRWYPVAGNTTEGNSESFPADEFPWHGCCTEVNAIAGIGNPQRFFSTLTQLGVVFKEHSFADHHRYTDEELVHFRSKVVVMTAKDAVKCKPFAAADWWFLSVEAELPDSFYQQLIERLRLETHAFSAGGVGESC